MRIVDRLVSAGHLPALALDREALAGDMPAPGAKTGAGVGLYAVLAAEFTLDLQLREVLAGVERELAPWAGKSRVPIELVSDPLASRAAYQDWLRQRLGCDGPREGVEAGESGEPGDPAELALDALFANLMVMITQTLVHAFVHWQWGERDLADAIWEMSGAAMMHATGIVNALAPRHRAPRPTRAAGRDNCDVALPRVAAARREALEYDRRLAERCRAAASRAAVAQQDADLAAVCARVEAWHAELAGWRLGRGLPRLDVNPCTDIERVPR